MDESGKRAILFTKPDMVYYEDRLQSFKNWSKQILPDKYYLARAGFVYTGEGDIVQCFSCNVRVSEWDRTDLPFTEHLKWSPDCIFLKIVGYGASQDGVSQTSDHTNESRILNAGKIVPAEVEKLQTNHLTKHINELSGQRDKAKTEDRSLMETAEPSITQQLLHYRAMEEIKSKASPEEIPSRPPSRPSGVTTDPWPKDRLSLGSTSNEVALAKMLHQDTKDVTSRTGFTGFNFSTGTDRIVQANSQPGAAFSKGGFTLGGGVSVPDTNNRSMWATNLF
jgi:hypothetical protein